MRKALDLIYQAVTAQRKAKMSNKERGRRQCPVEFGRQFPQLGVPELLVNVASKDCYECYK